MDRSSKPLRIIDTLAINEAVRATAPEFAARLKECHHTNPTAIHFLQPFSSGFAASLMAQHTKSPNPQTHAAKIIQLLTMTVRLLSHPARDEW